MTQLNSLGLRCEISEGASPEIQLHVLDQRQLPDIEHWINVESAPQMVDLIKTLAVRGAPLIGVAAALTLAQEASRGASRDRFFQSAQRLRAARPTAVNLMWAVDRMERAGKSDNRNVVIDEAKAIFNEDVEMCLAMGRHGSQLIESGDSVLTICNTGGLATVGQGTAFAVLRAAHEQGKKIHVYACETRPLLQGGRLTTWELAKCGIPHTLITDSMAATLMQSGKIRSVFTGADRVSARGDYANKIGTYSLAVLSHFHRIPFYPVAPFSTVDLKCRSGEEIEIEQRSADEVRGFVSPKNSLRWAPQDVQVFNPSFDVTPAELVTRIVLDRGVFSVVEFQNWIKSQERV